MAGLTFCCVFLFLFGVFSIWLLTMVMFKSSGGGWCTCMCCSEE